MKRPVECTNNDLIILSRQITEFQETAEKSSLVVPGQLSYIIHRNEQLIMQRYAKYEKKRKELIQQFIEKDDKGNPKTEEVESNGEKTLKVVFTDEKAFEKAFEEMLQEKVELEFYAPKEIENKIGNVSGEQRVLNQMWYLLEVFENWDPKNKIGNVEVNTVLKSENNDDSEKQ